MTDPDGTIFAWSSTRFADPAKVQPHPPKAGVAPMTCTTCRSAYSFGPADVVHFVERPCIGKCGRIVPAGQYQCSTCTINSIAKRAAEAAARLAGAEPTPITDVEPEDPDEVDREREGQNPLYREAKQYAVTYTGTWDFLLSMKRQVTGPRGVRRPLTDKQVAAILAAKQRDIEHAARQAAAAKRVQTQTGRDLTSLPVGRTRAAVPNESGELTFILIDRPEPGNKWAGWVFVRAVQGPDEIRIGSQRPGETYSGQWPSLIDAILADPLAAVVRYGQAIGTCGICGKQLTNAESRTWGMGPYCRRKLEAGLRGEGSPAGPDGPNVRTTDGAES